MRRIVAAVGILTFGLAVASRGQEFYVPDTISEPAKRALQELKAPVRRPATPSVGDLAGWNRTWQEREESFKAANENVVKIFESSVTATKLAGVGALDIRPKGWRDNGRVLVYLHGGGYTYLSPASSLIDTVPVAHETGLRVVSVDYTRAPFAKFPQITSEVVAVLQALTREGYQLKRIAVYGDSAGGGLAAGAVLKMRDEGLGMPGAVVLWSPWSDITETGDTYRTLRDAEPSFIYEKHLKTRADAYADPKDQKDPYVSPVYGDYTKGFPPTLIQGGTKEIFLSNFVRQYQAIDGAGQPVKLDLYEGMWHVFQEEYDLPEAKLALRKMKAFLDEHLSH